MILRSLPPQEKEMVKKKPDPSLKGKKPVNKAKASGANAKAVMVTRNPGHITNRLKRSEVYGKYLQQKKAQKRQQRLEREKQADALGEDNGRTSASQQPKKTARTLDNTREVEPTLVLQDPEIQADEMEDEFARYFNRDTPPKVLITTRPRPSQKLFYFIADLQRLIPSLHFYPRKQFSLKEICSFATKRQFTHLIVLSESAKHCNGMTISHLGNPVVPQKKKDGDNDDDDLLDANKDDAAQPSLEDVRVGPTAFFKVSNVVTSQDIPNHGSSTSHIPELNLHGFGTRLGHRVGRLLGSLFPHDAQFQGRQVVTFHNQRDYIFVRHHRYVFEEKKKKNPTKVHSDRSAEVTDSSKSTDGDNQQSQQQQQPSNKSSMHDRVKARLQELGPRFTLKLRWLQEGTFDSQFGEYEWIHKRKEMDTTRRRFHL